MLRIRTLVIAVSFIVTSSVLQAQSNDFATGNMPMDANAMDTNGDKMISKQEFTTYMEKTFAAMAKGASSVSVSDAAQDFARGNMHFSAKAMDADHDGTISKDEFMAYTEKKFVRLQNADGEISVSDLAAYFARGNMHPKSK
jgi:hypothetical protein